MSTRRTKADDEAVDETAEPEAEAPAEAEPEEQEEEKAPTATQAQVGNWQPKIVEPQPDPVEAADEPAAPPRPVLPEGDQISIVYRGEANLAGPVVHGGVSYTFRPGQPVSVPREVAENVLTWPFETFEVARTED